MALKVHYAFSHPSNYMDSKQLRGAMYAAVLNASKRVHRLLMNYVDTWNHPVVFNMGNIGYKFGDIFVAISTDDKIFWWLEDGTDVRYMVMTPDFEPKTAPGRIISTTGQGGPDYLDPLGRPGIEARHVLDEIAKQDFPKFQSDVLKVTAHITFFPKSGMP